MEFAKGPIIDVENWESGKYSPTPTIIEAAMALYSSHTVEDIFRNDASAINLASTESAISNIISEAHQKSDKVICFVTRITSTEDFGRS